MNDKRIIFEKLTVREESKIKAGDENSDPPYPYVECQLKNDVVGDKPEILNCHLID